MKYFVFFIALIISVSTIGFGQVDTTKTDSTATPAVFTPPTKAELDSIRSLMNEKDPAASATVEDILNMFILVKYGEVANLKSWTKKNFAEIPSANKKGWAAKFAAHFEMIDGINQENIKNLVTVTSDQENRLNTAVSFAHNQATSVDSSITDLSKKIDNQNTEIKTVHNKVNTTIMAVAGEDADRDDEAEGAMAQLIKWAKEQNNTCSKNK